MKITITTEDGKVVITENNALAELAIQLEECDRLHNCPTFATDMERIARAFETEKRLKLKYHSQVTSQL